MVILLELQLMLEPVKVQKNKQKFRLEQVLQPITI